MRDVKFAVLMIFATLALVFTVGNPIGDTLIGIGGRFKQAATAPHIEEYDDRLPVTTAPQARRR